MDINERISKLLALSESPVEAEAQQAILKAKELMMKYKLSKNDIKTKCCEVKEIITNITCSKRRDPWIIDLGNVIATNYCCRCFFKQRKGKQTVIICFYGFEDDSCICEKIFLYALDCIQSWIKSIRRRTCDIYSANQLRWICDSYADGFISGIKTAYLNQQELHQEWGLVAVVPVEVQHKAKALTSTDFSGKSQRISEFYNIGFEDGTEFDPTTKLKVVNIDG